MNKVIPILPCPDVKAQAEYYQQLGFEVKGLYVSPNPYLSIAFGELDLHFYGNRKMEPSSNSSMCFISVDDVDQVYAVFASGIKKHTGKIPRSGIPRISKVRDLSSDRRFTLTDPGGNTFYIGTPVKSEAHLFFRTLEDESLTKKFEVLYDLVYSKEDCKLASAMLPKFPLVENFTFDLDKAKFLLVCLEIQKQEGLPLEETGLKKLLSVSPEKERSEWEKIRKRYGSILND